MSFIFIIIAVTNTVTTTINILHTQPIIYIISPLYKNLPLTDCNNLIQKQHYLLCIISRLFILKHNSSLINKIIVVILKIIYLIHFHYLLQLFIYLKFLLYLGIFVALVLHYLNGLCLPWRA